MNAMRYLLVLPLSTALLALGAACDVAEAPNAPGEVFEVAPPVVGQVDPSVEPTTEAETAEAPFVQLPMQMGIQAWSGVDPNASHPPMPPAFVVSRVPKRLSDAPRAWLDADGDAILPPAQFTKRTGN